MSHECPECGQLCYCGGDWDDCLLNDDNDVINCSHCDGYDSDDDSDWQDTLMDDDEVWWLAAESEERAEVAEKLSEIPEARGVVIQSKEAKK